ncbi:hypothetical protein CMO96_00825 [Candidatus Woesebacteria bacterium]|nr:hypothetical protein [Candidatus Woesebacteria bacterium]
MKKKKTRSVYVVTRNGRRIEEDNYFGEQQAKERAQALIKMLKEWDDDDKGSVDVIRTSQPYKIW